ncbi:MAG: hypothetical protein K2Q01_03110 [Rickettsiales bacterium]|nr:hypothetical protein [Rickettsiales bacterium]
MTSFLHQIRLQKAIIELFTRHNDVSFAIMAKYPSHKGPDGCMETAPLSHEDQKAFIESRRFLMSALRVALPEMMKKNPDVFDSSLIRDKPIPSPYAYSSTPLLFSPEAKCFGITLGFAPGRKTPVHSHGIGCVSYVASGEMREMVYDQKGESAKSLVKRQGESTIVSPHSEEADNDRHMIFASSPDETSLLIHIYDCLALTPEGRVKDLTGSTRALQANLLVDIERPAKGGTLAPYRP